MGLIRFRQQNGFGLICFLSGGLLCSALALWLRPVVLPVPGQEKAVAYAANQGCEMQCLDFSLMKQEAKERAEKGSGTKFREIKSHELPSEFQPGWDPSKQEEPEPRFPRALILGFAKCGTAALVTFLPLHPDIVTVNWEVNYFCDQHYYEYDLKWYKSMMPLSYSYQFTIEKSPCYIMERRHFERMMAFNSTLKVMVTLRNPVDLLLSKYAQMMSGFETFGKEKTPIESVLYRDPGKLNVPFIDKFAVYVKYIRDLYDIVPREQILIIDGDELIRNPLAELKQMEKFLGIQPYFSDQDIYFDEKKGFYCYKYRDTGVAECLGSSKGRKHEVLKPELNKTLHDHLRPFNEELYKLIGRRFPWD